MQLISLISKIAFGYPILNIQNLMIKIKFWYLKLYPFLDFQKLNLEISQIVLDFWISKNQLEISQIVLDFWISKIKFWISKIEAAPML